MEMTELLPTHVLPPVKFHPVTLENLDNAANTDSAASFTLGHFSNSDNFVWVTRGSCVEVINRHTACRLGAWSFGAITKEENTMVTCAIEFSRSVEPLLLIGLHCRGVGMLCIFNPVKSKLVSAIELPSKVVSLEIIETSKYGEVMISYLRSFNGLVAVGLDGGLVYILDLCLDVPTLCDETQPATLNAIPASTPQIESIRESLDTSEYLAIILDKESCTRGSYFYRRPDGKTMQSFDACDVCVTSMKYIPQIGALIIGLNFGCFQVWKMDRLMLEYSSPYEADLAPITQFVYQEPENDPKKFVYLWIGRGPTFVDRRDGDCSALSLYQLSYDNKRILGGHGVLYSNLQCVMHKFEHPLTADPYNVNGLNVYGSTLIACEVIKNAAHQRVSRREDGIEEHHEDLSLCAFLWDASTDPESKPVYLLGLFDLNRWYHAQMPHSVRPNYLCHGVCPFFAFCNLEDIVEIAGPENILAAQISVESVTRYRSTVIPAPEQHFYPSALAFDLHCLLESSIVNVHFSGVQNQILYDLRKNPAALIEPGDTFNRSTLAEILPKFCEAGGDLAVSDQREALLNVCIENAMTDVILTCISTWADGEYSRSGCTLRLILNAAWTRVVKTKDTINKTCVPLFDCSVTGVDKQTVSLLHQQECELGRLCRVFQQLLNLAGTTTAQGAHDLEVKLNVTSLLHEHMQVLTWLVVVGLLPETMEGDETTNKYNYPAESLSQAFVQRRQELNSLHQDLAFTDLLMIDGLIEHVGSQVKDLWSKEGGNGLYPPPSLHSVLAIYLLKDVPINAKHSVLFYLLLDLIPFVQDIDQKLVQQCLLFAQCFGMSPSLARLVQGFWLLDHREYSEALHVLLDPIVCKQDLAEWQHTRIVKALLYQGESRGALMYMNTRLPNPTTANDVKLKLTALLASGNINQAFEYQRKLRDPSNCLDLIQHFFTGCMQTKNLGHLVQLPLDDFEDKQLAEFLRNTSTCESMELLVMYYLQRCRYVEAIRLNEQIQKLRVVDTNPQVVQRAIARDAIIQAHIKNLPEIQRDLVRARKSTDQPNRRERIEVSRPQPLSTKVNNNPLNRINSRATLICAVMEKVQEVQFAEPEKVDVDDEPPEVFVSLPSTPKPKHSLNESSIQAQSIMEKDLSQFLKRTPPSGRSPMSKISDSAKKRMAKYQNAEAMSLLATPPVKRVAKSRVKAHATPQSILKVRNAVRDNMSPLVRTTPAGDPNVRRNPFVTISGSTHVLKPGTPKLLRFVLSPSRSSTQISRPEDETSPPSGDAQNDTLMSQVVDEEITFNFNVSHLKSEDKMDTDNTSCPSTPRDVDDRGTPSPDKSDVEPSTASPKVATPKQLRFSDAQTPREQISQFVEVMDDNESEKADVVVEMKKKSESPSAKTILAAVRAEYSAAETSPTRGDAVSTESEDASDEEDSSDDEPGTHMVTETTAIVETRARVQQTPKEVVRLVRESPEPSPLRFESSEVIRLSDEQGPSARLASRPKPELKRLVIEAKHSTSSRSSSSSEIVKPKPEMLTPPRVSPERRDSPPEIVEVIEIGSSQSDTEDFGSPPVLEQMVDLDTDPSSPPQSPECKERSPEWKEQTPSPQKPNSPRRSPRIARRMTGSGSDDSPEKRTDPQSSPLSSDAFMMKVRHAPRGSRDHTPEAAGDEPIQFTFSDPLALESQGHGGSTPAPNPFIFSPPVTRSRGKRRDPESIRSLRHSILDPSSGSNMTGLLDVSASEPSMADQSSVFETSQTQLSRSTKKTRRKITMDSTSDSPINFVSPATSSTQSEGDLTKSGKKMTLRSRFRIVRPERKSVRLMKK